MTPSFEPMYLCNLVTYLLGLDWPYCKVHNKSVGPNKHAGGTCFHLCCWKNVETELFFFLMCKWKNHGGGKFFLTKNKKCTMLIRYLRVTYTAFHSIFVDCTAKSYVLTLYCKRLSTITTSEQSRFSVHSSVAKLFLCKLSHV